VAFLILLGSSPSRTEDPISVKTLLFTPVLNYFILSDALPAILKNASFYSVEMTLAI